MLRKKNLPSLDSCVESSATVRAIPIARFVEAIWVMAVVAGLGVAHTHLRFEMADMRLQQKHFQSERKNLENRQARLERQMESLRDDSVLQAFAESQGMQRISIAHHAETVIVPSNLHAKYLGPQEESPRAEMAIASAFAGTKEENPDVLQRALFAFLDGGKATAGTKF